MTTERIIKILSIVYSILGFMFIALGLFNVIMFLVNLSSQNHSNKLLFTGMAFAALGLVVLLMRMQAIKKIRERDEPNEESK